MNNDDVPVLACRPWDPEQYDERSKGIWDLGLKLALAEGIPELSVYPGSTSGACSRCGIAVAVGPKQQEVMQQFASVEILCTVCVVVMAHDEAEAVSFDVRYLGNDFKRA